MAEQRVTNQWQLEDTGESLEQWKLQDDEQRLPSHMELQEDYDSPEMIDPAWQPIDYRAMQAAASGKSRRGGAALGALLVVALLGVGGYLAWFYMGQSGGDSPAGTDAAGIAAGNTDPSAVAELGDKSAGAAVITDTTVAPGNVAAQTAQAESTPAAATDVMTETGAPAAPPAAVPVLPATAEVRQAVVNSPVGVNMRATASATGALLATLDDQTTHVVASGPTADAAGANWYELALPDQSRGWVSGDYITVTVQTLPYADAETLLASVGMTLTAPSAAPAAAPADAAVAAPVTATTQLDGAAATTADEPTVRLTGVISAPAGLNLRRAAETGDNVIELLQGATPVTVIGRSADSQWVQVELADKRRGWLATQFVSITGDVTSIPAGTSFPLTPTVTSAVTTVTTVTAEAPVASTAPTTATTPAADVGASGAFTVTSIMGVNVRAQPSNDVPGIVQLSWNTSGQAIGRTADSQWVRVTIPSGQSGWVAMSAIALDRDVATLPVVN